MANSVVVVLGVFVVVIVIFFLVFFFFFFFFFSFFFILLTLIYFLSKYQVIINVNSKENILTDLCLASHKWDICKQCRPRSDQGVHCLH